MVENIFKFDAVNEEDEQEITSLFPRPGKPLGEIFFVPTGCLITKHYMQSAKVILEMDVRPDDTWIVSFPRSGTTRLEELVWLLQNNLNYDRAKSEYLHKRFMNLELVAKSSHFRGVSEFDDLDSIKKAPSPRFIKSHLPIELLPKQLAIVKPKIFYIYRNPKDVVVSLFYFFQLVYQFKGTFEQFADIFLKEKLIYQPYWNHVLGFWEFSKRNDNVKFVCYEEMNQNISKVIKEICCSTGINVEPEDIELLADHLDIENMRKNRSINKEEQMLRNKVINKGDDAQFIRRGVTGEWKQTMNPQMIKKFDDWILKNIANSDFKPFYEF